MIFETRRIVEPRFLRFSAVKNTISVVFESLVAFIAEKAYTSTYCAHFVRNARNRVYVQKALYRGGRKEIAAKYDVEIVVRDSDNEYYKPTSLGSDGYKYVRKIVQSVFDYAAAVPFILPAGTDARRFTGLSDSVIRFAPIDIDGQQYASVHSETENINVDKIPLAVKFYKELLRNYK